MAKVHLFHLWPEGHTREVPLEGPNANVLVRHPDILNLACVVELRFDDKAVGILVTAFLLVAKVGGNVTLDLVVKVAECVPVDRGHCRWRQWVLHRGV